MQQTITEVLTPIGQSYATIHLATALALIISTFISIGLYPTGTNRTQMIGGYIVRGLLAFVIFPVVEWTLTTIYDQIIFGAYFIVATIFLVGIAVFLLAKGGK